MAKWVRNWLTTLTVDLWGAHHAVMMYKELLLAMGYTLNSDDGDAAWTAAGNVLVNQAPYPAAGGFQVSATDPRQIYDPGGRFTQQMADDKVTINLFGGALNGGLGDEQNHSIWAITEYIDANNVKVDREGFTPFGWVTDTQLGGRVTRFDGTKLTGGAWAILDGPPGTRVQVRLDYQDNNNAFVRMAPMGKTLVGTGDGVGDAITGAAPAMKVTIAGLIGKLSKHAVGLNVTIAGATNAPDNGTYPVTAIDTATGEVSYTNANGVGEAGFSGTATLDAISTMVPSAGIWIGDQYARQWRMHAYFDGGSGILYGKNQDGDWLNTMVAKLLDTDAEDPDPWVIWNGHGWHDYYDTNDPMYGLDGAVSPAEISHWFTWLQRANGDNTGFYERQGRRVNIYGKSPLRFPWVVMNNVATVGACVRGRVGVIAVGYNGFQDVRPFDAAGAWLHWVNGVFIPRNGPQDQLPIFPPSS